MSHLRDDLVLIAHAIEPHSRVLDIGCGDGTLLKHLERARNIDGQGLELSHKGVHTCVKQGLAVIQGDADHDLADYPQNAFDYVVLSQTLQLTRNPRQVVRTIVHIGRYGIVSFPNFGYWRSRLSLLWHGRMPVTKTLPDEWFDTLNIHLCTIRDFTAMCHDNDIVIKNRLIPAGGFLARLWSNIFAREVIFIIAAHQNLKA